MPPSLGSSDGNAPFPPAPSVFTPSIRGYLMPHPHLKCPSTRTGAVPWLSSHATGLPPSRSFNPAPATQASVRALHENARINTPALRRLRRCAPRPPPACSSKHPFLILTYSSSSPHVPTVNSHASSPLPPLTCDNSSRCSTSNSPISCPMRPLYAQLDWPQEVPSQDVFADDGRGSHFK